MKEGVPESVILEMSTRESSLSVADHGYGITEKGLEMYPLSPQFDLAIGQTNVVSGTK